jgi:opacity protein-like surface antigen
MTRIATLTLITLFITSTAAFSQSTEQDSQLSENSRALQFGITENFTLSSFQGSVFSYKWHTAADRANRVSLSLSSELNDQAGVGTTQDSQNRINLAVELNLSRIHYANPENDIKFYFGYGPGLDVLYNRVKTTTSQIDGENRQAGIGLSFGGLTGVEWFFHRSMSLHAEYRGSFRYRHFRDRSESDVQPERGANINRLSLGGDGVRFGLSVYF